MIRGVVIVLAAWVGCLSAHNSLVIPTPRNSVDGSVPAMQHGGTVPGGLSCTCSDDQSCPMGAAREVGGAGQPCLWWSQGCSIGCDYCMTDPRHPDNGGKIPTKPITGNPPHADKAGFRKSYCNNSKTKSVLPKEYWTLNIHAEEGAEDDSYQYNPWRAPGTAPVVDPCGQAGGKYKITPMGGASVFGTVNVSGLVLEMGDLGSKVLPPTHPSKVPTWKVGSTPRVAWGMRFNHGGGYQYRLCPIEKWPCSEKDFQEMPLDFVRDAHAIMWNNGSLYPIKGKFVDDSVCPVVPQGSTWARNPIPRIHTDNVGMAYVGKCYPQTAPAGQPTCRQEGAPWCWAKDDCQQFPSPCPFDDGWYMGNATHMPEGNFLPDSNKHEGWCSGDWTLGMVSDEVIIPKSIKPGQYVLSWRMDCEETAQIWQNCADVNIEA
eukprot:m.18068 g.18068  ORF g.18068 m.18068 type:complete len:431 (+) comp6181_c0_seq1:40-1332(+)